MPHPTSARCAILAALCSATLLFQCSATSRAQAQARPADAASDPWMTAKQLRHCVGLEIDKDLLEEELAQRKRALDYADERVENSKRSLEKQRAELDRSNARLLAGFNERVAAHNALLAEADARVDAFNEAVREHNAALPAYNRACTGIRYRPKDWLIEKDRQMQARKQPPAS